MRSSKFEINLKTEYLFEQKRKKKIITANVPLVFKKTKDKKEYIVECPILPVLGFGKTEQEATKMFEESMNLFLKSALDMPKILKEQAKIYGWKILSENKNDFSFDSINLKEKNNFINYKTTTF